MRKVLAPPDLPESGYDDDDVFVLPPIGYREFVALGLWSGCSDAAYDAWTLRNGFTDPSELSEEALAGLELRLERCESSPGRMMFDPTGEGVWVEYWKLQGRPTSPSVLKVPA